jgi:hypothetical protein
LLEGLGINAEFTRAFADRRHEREMPGISLPCPLERRFVDPSPRNADDIEARLQSMLA